MAAPRARHLAQTYGKVAGSGRGNEARVPPRRIASSIGHEAMPPTGAPVLRISVMVPTYRRPDDLRRCLAALAHQELRPDEVIVVVRESDRETRETLVGLDTPLTLRTVTVAEPGLVFAMNAGLAAVRTEIVAITDDDAAPHSDWTKRIVAHFMASPSIGGVGGRDYMYVGGVLRDGRARVVGRIPAYGKHVGNHHVGFGAPRDVDMLKGVNGAYRTQAIAPIGFDTRLRGSGAQVHWEMSLGIALRRAGWRLVYDPEVAVDHFLARRFDEDQRDLAFNPSAMQNAAYNEALVRMEHASTFERVAFFAWAIVVGTRAAPGAVQWVRFVPRERSLAGAKLRAAVTGRCLAWKELWNATRPGESANTCVLPS
jgi:glycosyltransferase involved in cell wall biosynthesis